MKKLLSFFLLLFTFCVPAFAQQGLDTLSLKNIFYEPLLAGHRPSLVRFSTDQSQIYYQANDSAMIESEMFRVDLDGKHNERFKDDFERRINISPDGKKLVYSQKGDLWIADISFKNKRKLVSSKGFEYNPVWGPDSKRLAYVENGNVWIIDTQEAGLTQVTNRTGKESGYSISGWAGADRLILQQYDSSDEKEYYFPEYVHEYVQSGRTRRGIAKETILVAPLDSGKVKSLDTIKGYPSTSISADGKYLAIDNIDAPQKYRKITVYNLEEDSSSTVVFQDSTKGWLYNTDVAFAPEGDRLMILSEKDGWNHIYTVQPDGSDMKERDSGNFEVPWAQWLDGHTILYASTKDDPGVRNLYTVDVRNDKIQKLTSMQGYRQDFALSRDKQHVVYQYTTFNQPFELYSINVNHPGKEVRLTHTIPDRFKNIDWPKEDYLRIPGRDGTTKLSMSVLKPRHQQEGKKHPVVVFVHGAGSLQNVYQGWSNSYPREYMFNQFLTEHGYYVIEVDYRQSLGYGRKFREDVTNWMGKYETQDIEDGINYLAQHYAGADTSRVGIYGGSYGGFMALYATSTAPEYFDAAAALRAVTNWRNYYHTNPWYTLPRLGTPEADSANYARSSPITYADSLKRPILILHGLRDNNVGFQDPAQYIHALIEAGNKHFDMMMYPTERHSFTDPDDWYDEYSRIYTFFNEKLK